MSRDLWLYPSPSQDNDFLLLQYSCTAGQPTGATSSLYRHPWSDHDHVGMAAEVEIIQDYDDGYIVKLTTYSWDVWASGASPSCFELFNGCRVTYWETHENFGRFTDAEAFAQFAWQRWRATGSGGSSGMRWRDDLDRCGNPTQALAV